MTDILITGNLTVNGNIIINECPIIQSNIVTGAAYSSGTAKIPFDDTIPQDTEGQFALSCSITPKRADSILEIYYDAPTSGSTDNQAYIASLFWNLSSDALKTVLYSPNPTLNYTTPTDVSLKHWVTAGTTSTVTFTVRYSKTGGTNLCGIGKNQYADTLFYMLRVTEIMNVSGNFIEV